MRFQRNISLLLGRMEARRRVEFTKDSAVVALVSGGPATTTARRGGEAAATRLGMSAAKRRDSEAAARYAWQGRWPSVAPWKRQASG
jgi:hypothetical protein